DDDVHAHDPRQRGDGQGDGGDHRQTLGRDGHPGVGATAVEVRDAGQEVELARGDVVQPTVAVAQVLEDLEVGVVQVPEYPGAAAEDLVALRRHRAHRDEHV